MNTRLREIHTICIFALCLEHNTSQRYAVAFQPKDQNTIAPVSVDELLDATFEVREEDCDLVLVDVPEQGQTEVDHHRCQLTSFVYQPGTTEKDWVNFLKKKLSYANDDDLRLVIHCEQEGVCNYRFLSAFLCLDETNCPYSQVFLVAQIADNPAEWQCYMLYPELAILPVLTEGDANSLLRDRPRFNKQNGHE
ncbi:hypothetical protein [Crateriforma conspicua]|nr:hypothetical protein [Crateriforma conspicua]